MKEGASIFEFGGFRLDPARRLLFGRDGRTIPLKAKVFDTLLYFVEHADRLLDKTELMNAVWAGVIVEENSLNQNVSLLRRVLGESPGDNEYIVTVPGRGYRFVATVKMLPAASKDSDVGARADLDRLAGTSNVSGRMKRKYLVSTAAVLAVLAALVWVLDWKDEQPVQPSTSPPTAGESAPTNVVRLQLDVLPGHRLTGGVGYETYDFGLQRPSLASLALSPDGRYVVYAAADGETTRLYRRRLDQQQTVAIPGTEGAAQPFFSPDSRHVAFHVGAALMRAPIEGGARTIAVSGNARTRLATYDRSEGPPATSSWTQNDTLLINGEEGIYELPAEGGELVQVSRVDRNAGEYAHVFPQMLPERRALLYNVMRQGAVPSGWIVKVQPLDGSESKTIIERASHPVYVPPGHIVFARSGALLAVPFDLQSLEVTGSPVVVVEDVMHAERGANARLSNGTAQFSVSSTGTLAYLAGGVYPESTQSLVLVDRQGEARELPLPRGRYRQPRFSPDGKRLSYSVGHFGDAQIWVYDFGLDVQMRLTNNGFNTDPVWSPDGRSLAFGQPSVRALYAVPADGSSSPRRLGQGGRPWAWFGDVLGFIDDPDEYIEIWTLHLESGERQPFVRTDSQVWHPDLSPDGKWVAYVSEEMGSVDHRDLVDVSGFQVYVRPFPEGVPLQIISSGGGFGPAWSADGRELFFYQFADASTGVRVRLMAVDVDTSSTFTRGRPRMLFEGDYDMTLPTRNYDVSPDGQQFVMSGVPFWGDPQPATKIEIVLNWFEELQALAPKR